MSDKDFYTWLSLVPSLGLVATIIYIITHD